MKKTKIGRRVIVFDRYRFAIPLVGVVTDKSKKNDGVEVKLLQSNNSAYPINCKIWVSKRQLRKAV